MRFELLRRIGIRGDAEIPLKVFSDLAVDRDRLSS